MIVTLSKLTLVNTFKKYNLSLLFAFLSVARMLFYGKSKHNKKKRKEEIKLYACDYFYTFSEVSLIS